MLRGDKAPAARYRRRAQQCLEMARPVASERSDCSRSYMDRNCLADRATVRRIAKPKRCRSEHVGVHTRHAARLIRQHRPDASPFLVREFVAHDSQLQFGALNHGLRAGLKVADLKGTVLPVRYRECPKQGNLVLFYPSIALPSLPGAAPAFLSLTAWLECLRDDGWQ